VKQSERDRTCRVGLARSDCRAAKCRLMTMPLPLGYQSLIRERYGSLTANFAQTCLAAPKGSLRSPSLCIKGATLQFAREYKL
jgi:hypothetical protein